MARAASKTRSEKKRTLRQKKPRQKKREFAIEPAALGEAVDSLGGHSIFPTSEETALAISAFQVLSDRYPRIRSCFEDQADDMHSEHPFRPRGMPVSTFLTIIESDCRGSEEPPLPSHPAFLFLLDVARKYSIGREMHAAGSTNLNPEIEKIQKACDALKLALAQAPEPVRQRMQIAQALKWASNDFSPECRPKSIVDLLRQIEVILDTGLDRTIKRGTRPKKYLSHCVETFVLLWTQAERKFQWRFDLAKGADGQEFVGVGAQFVWHLISVIDPEVRIGEVKNALKELSLERNSCP